MIDRDLLRTRSLWQESNRELLIVALQPGPDCGSKTAGLAIDCVTAWAGLESRRSGSAAAAVIELDFWCPRLAELAEDQGLQAPARDRDVLDLFDEVVKTTEWHSGLIATEGVPRTRADASEQQRWAEQLASRLMVVKQPVGGEGASLLIPARVDDLRSRGLRDRSPFQRAIRTEPSSLVRASSAHGVIYGQSVLRLILGGIASVHELGMLVLLLPNRWSLVSALAITHLADVVALCYSQVSKNERFWHGVVEHLERRRRDVVQRSHFQEDIVVALDQGAGPGEGQGVEIGSSRPMPEALRSLNEPGSMSTLELTQHLDRLAASKAAGTRVRIESDLFSADRRLLARLKQLEPSQRQVRILVEKGPYGELPIRRFSEMTLQQLRRLDPGGSVDGFEICPVPIGHHRLLQLVCGKDVSDEPGEVGAGGAEPGTLAEAFENDLITIPYYMLGALADQGLLLPWHVIDTAIDDEKGGSPERESDVMDCFFFADTMCRYNGVLFAVPYSLLQKILLVKQGCRAFSRETLNDWNLLHRRLIEIKQEIGQWPLFIETATDHVGVWYDWLELATAFGGGDFRALSGKEGTFRGSDYGECLINSEQTIRGTEVFLDIFGRTLRNLPQGLDWDGLLERFIADESGLAAIAWSDVLAYHWKEAEATGSEDAPRPLGLEASLEMHRYPMGDTNGRSSIEGWVLAVPSRVDEQRRPFVATVVDWFLSPAVQSRYAAAGGNTARRDIAHALGPVQREVHRSLLSPLRRPALKMTFREAPDVVWLMREQIASWISAPPDDRSRLASQLDGLARDVVTRHLLNRPRYRSRSYWSQESMS